jgi:hypothetical protein
MTDFKGVCKVPIVCLSFNMPASGLPPICDFCTLLRSVVFTGLNLDREPLDVGKTPGANNLHIVKGYTRASVAMMIALAVTESVGPDQQLDDPSVWVHIEPLVAVLDHVWFVHAVVPPTIHTTPLGLKG